MPEPPDLVVYRAALEARIAGARLEQVRLASPFLVRSTDPPPAALEGKTVHAVSRLGKRIVIALEGSCRRAPPHDRGAAASDIGYGTSIILFIA